MLCNDDNSNITYVVKIIAFSRPVSPVAQSVTCLATDASLTADPGVTSSIPARSHTFMEIDYICNNFYGHSPPRPGPILSWRLIIYVIISTVILLPFAESFKKDCCQFRAKVCARSTG